MQHLIIPSQQCWMGYKNAAIHVWLGDSKSEWHGTCVGVSVTLYLVDTIETDFAQSLLYSLKLN